MDTETQALLKQARDAWRDYAAFRGVSVDWLRKWREPADRQAEVRESTGCGCPACVRAWLAEVQP